MRYSFLSLCIFLSSMIKAQDFDWWKNNVHWDGVTDWYQYLILSPKYFGPNALPVPAINNGSIDSIKYFGTTLNFHFSKGDNTQNAMFYGNYTTKQNTIAVDAQFVPFEVFQMTKATKEERKVYYAQYYKKTTTGDVIVNTNIQLFKRLEKKIALALRIGLRAPSGGAQGAARYTDTPGYWFDVGWGKKFRNEKLKWIGMLGFMAWQTNDPKNRQNDAFLFGSGFEWNHANLRLQSYISGYAGYMNNGDHPLLFKLNFEKKKKNIVYIARFQQGLHDFNYSSFETGVKCILGK